jgi:hypothetical protein
MIHESGSGLLDLVLRRYTFLEGKVDLLISMPKWRLAGEGRSTYFCCQNGTLLWKVDPSFRNSVTGSGSVAKCSNILQDTYFWERPYDERMLCGQKNVPT